MQWPKVNTSLPGPRAKEFLALDAEFMSPSLTRAYPFVADHGEGCWIWDVDGNLFLDFTAGLGVSTTGHGHTKVTAAVERQVGRLLHFSITDFYHPLAAQLAAQLARLFPTTDGPTRARVYLCNSGAEAIEAAIKLARYHTKRTRLVGFHGAFHGRTIGALSLSDSQPVQKQGFGPLLEGVAHVPYSLVGLEYLEKSLRPAEVAAVFVEPIQGEAGVIVPEPEFLPELRRLCDRHGILLVADEVQTGMGRTGKMFACEHWEVIPDILCVAQGLASGLPLGAIIARAEVMDWPAGTHTSTFGGNPLACAAALATIDLLRTNLIENARAMGTLLAHGLQGMARQHPLIADVRGRGLLLGVEVAADGPGQPPAVALRNTALHMAFERGLLLLGGGHNVLRLAPPLIVSVDEVEVCLQIFEATLAGPPSARPEQRDGFKGFSPPQAQGLMESSMAAAHQQAA